MCSICAEINCATKEMIRQNTEHTRYCNLNNVTECNGIKIMQRMVKYGEKNVDFN